jgi:hypothetical protein
VARIIAPNDFKPAVGKVLMIQERDTPNEKMKVRCGALS